MAGELVKGSCEEAAPVAAAPAAAAVVMPGELLPKSSSRRCGLCGGSSDGESPQDVLPDATESKESCIPQSLLGNGTQDFNKADGFGAQKGWLGRLLGPLSEHVGVVGAWVHENCAIWSPEVYFSGVGRLKNVKAAVRRGRSLRCSLCNLPGATIGCRVDRCPQNYHLPCARSEGSLFNHRKYLVACYDHIYLFRSRRRKRSWLWKDHPRSVYGKVGEVGSIYTEQSRISKTQRRAAATAALLKDVEAEEKCLEKSGEDEEFVRRERKLLQRDLAEIAPVKLGGCSATTGGTTSLFPEGWDSVAGLQDVVQCMKEMVTLPLLYPEVFQRLGISPSRGVLLHGHPGTGKTLVVRALAGACAHGGQEISYFARKGADILGKYVGDSERQLRLLFQVAEQCQPAIIFFDEIDGLAPSRCGDRDQTQSSVVSTLLALMDGLSSRGSVVVIGATNRPDALDPALRRPGRFDREIYFPLPSTVDRAAILGVHTRTLTPQPSAEMLAVVAKATPGFAGADLQALCVQAAMTALRRAIPFKQILDAAEKGNLGTKLPDLPTIQVRASDWAAALAQAPVPCSGRLASASLNQVPEAPLPRHLVPVLLPALVEVIVNLGVDDRTALPPALLKAFSLTQCVLKSARGRTTMSPTEKQIGLPGNWLSLVKNSFKHFPNSLGIALEDIFVSAGIVGAMHQASHPSQTGASVLFPRRISFDKESHVLDLDLDSNDTRGGSVPGCSQKEDQCIDTSSLLDSTHKPKWSGGRFRLLLLGGAKHGQRLVAGAIFLGFEGLTQMRTLSLPAMLMEGCGDMEQGLIRIVGEARRTTPCVLFMPQIEQWVMHKFVNTHEVEKKVTCCPGSQESSVLHAAEGRHYSNGTAQIKVEPQEGEPQMVVSNAWNVMKQQLQSMPPDTSIMLLATCEAGAEALPSEVISFFSCTTMASGNSSSCSPCFCIQLPSLEDITAVIVRASQDAARVMAIGYAQKALQLREYYAANFQDKLKLKAAGALQSLTAAVRFKEENMAAARKLNSDILKDLAKELRYLGQDWGRNLGKIVGKSEARNIAKQFGRDLGWGITRDFEREQLRILDCGFSTEMANGLSNLERNRKEESWVDLECNLSGQLTADVQEGQKACRGLEGDLERCLRNEVSAMSPNGEPAVLNGTVNSSGKNEHMETHCSAPDISESMNACAPVQNMCHIGKQEKAHSEERNSEEQHAGIPQVGIFQHLEASNSPEPLSRERKVLQNAISFFGFRLLNDPQLGELRSVTAVLGAAPAVAIHDFVNGKSVNFSDGLDFGLWPSCGRGYRQEDKCPAVKTVRGLVAVGLKAQRGLYQTGREVEFELRGLVELLYSRVQEKIDNGKDGLQYFHLTTQASMLVDLLASWVYEVRKLEVAANMHNLPISRSISQCDPSTDKQGQGGSVLNVQEKDGRFPVNSSDCLKHPSVTGSLDGTAEGDLGHANSEKAQTLCTIFSEDAPVLNGSEVGGDISAAETDSVLKANLVNGVLTHAEVSLSRTEPDGLSAHPLTPKNRDVCTTSVHPATAQLGLPVTVHGNGCHQPLKGSVDMETKFLRENIAAELEVTPLHKFVKSAGASLEKGDIICSSVDQQCPSILSPLQRSKQKQQALCVKPECLEQLETVVKNFLEMSTKKEGLVSSAEALHDLVSSCVATLMAASQKVLSSFHRSKTAQQVIFQWAELTCQCQGNKTGGKGPENGQGVDSRQAPMNGKTRCSTECTAVVLSDAVHVSWKNKRKRSSISGNPSSLKRRAVMSCVEASHPVPAPSLLELVSPLKQTDKHKAFICLGPVTRAITDLVRGL